MCGIAGIVHVKGERPSAVIAGRMTAELHHRGPDATGLREEGRAVLGHRRLSIIDLASGQQPMCNEDGTLWVTYNGEIFNHASLRPGLERQGHRYKSHCDTESILHAYEESGADCVKRFRGMFAFAIWDTKRHTLFAARDRLGIKPFYYYWDGTVFAFASEIKALFKHPAISARLDESLLPEYLSFGFTNDDRTLFAGIRKLMPGHTLTLSVGADQAQLHINQYWDVPAQSEGDELHDDAWWIKECRARLEESIELRLMSDVPLGMFLSGGVDSSAIAAVMSRLVSTPIQTFAVGYSESAWSELGYARQVAKHIGSEHHEVIVGKDDFLNVLPTLIWHEDEPIFWPSSVALYFVSALAARHVKVVLTGEGSDEMFGGYDRYQCYLFNRRCMNVYGLLPRGLRDLIREQLSTSALLSGSVRRKLAHACVGRRENYESLQLDNFYCAFSDEDQRRLLAGGIPGGQSPYSSVMRYWNASAGRTTIGRMLYTDLKTYLVELLMKQDQMSMACSLESRVPFLDHTFVEFATRVPDRLKIRKGEGKYIVKKAVEDLLPRAIVYRKKMGFPTPFREWLGGRQGEGLLHLLEKGGGLLGEYCDMAEVRRLAASHRSGKVDATDRIWRLLNLQIWGEIFLSGHVSAPAADHLVAASNG